MKGTPGTQQFYTGNLFGTLLGLCMVLMLQQQVLAEQVFLEVKPGISASANYSPGEEGAPSVLILHGFLQTHGFSTVRRLHESLAESGYTVLSPNLSLGIDKRKQSLSCEAIHTHALEDDVAELAIWVDWLQKQHARPVVLVGHSAGGLMMTRYLSEHPQAPVSKQILISLSYLEGAPVANPDGPIAEYRLGFCEKYVSIPAAYESYVGWDAEAMLDAIKAARDRTAVILGSGDPRIKAEWRGLLAGSGINVINVEGANHFFDNAHEFDLLEAVEEILADESA